MKLFKNDVQEMHVGTIYMEIGSTMDDVYSVLDFLHEFAGCGKSVKNQITHVGEQRICDAVRKVIEVKLNDDTFEYIQHYREVLPIGFFNWKA